jgi:hypothetical protein
MGIFERKKKVVPELEDIVYKDKLIQSNLEITYTNDDAIKNGGVYINKYFKETVPIHGYNTLLVTLYFKIITCTVTYDVYQKEDGTTYNKESMRVKPKYSPKLIDVTSNCIGSSWDGISLPTKPYETDELQLAKLFSESNQIETYLEEK